MRTIICLTMLLCVGGLAWAQEAQPVVAPSPGGGAQPPAAMRMTPEMRARMMTMVQNLIIMSQNKALQTADGPVILQGNRLTALGMDMKVRRQVMLPLPPAPVPPTTPMPPATAPPTMPSDADIARLAAIVPTELLAAPEGGVIVVRGQQAIRLDRNLNVLNTETLPALPALTAQERAALCPFCAMMPMMHMMGMPPMGGPAAPPAGGGM